jgi:hypothetical protein
MGETAIATIETLLESTLENIEESESKYKLRQALSLLQAVEQHQIDAENAIESINLDSEVEENLRDLGYLD